jgi:two-component system response regulator HydG
MDKREESFKIRKSDVLVVDDDICIQNLFKIFLKSEGVDVRTTSGGIEALEILRHHKFRLIITDFNMPDMDGLELATKVREQHPETPVVMITGNTRSDVIEAAVIAGISKVLTKPIDLRTLMEVITSSLDASHNTVSA